MSISSSDVRDLGAPLVAEALGDLAELLLDQRRARGPRRRGSRAARAMRSMTSACSVLDLVGLQRGELRQAQVEDRAAPGSALSSKRVHQAARARRRGRATPRISSMTSSRLSSAMSRPSRMCARASFSAQLVLRPADDDLALVLDVVLRCTSRSEQRPRHAVDERDHVDAERRLHRRVLVELVEHDLRDRVALELDHEAHAAAVGLVLAGRRSRGSSCRWTRSAIFWIRPPSPPFLTL